MRNSERGTVEKLEGELATIRWNRARRVQQVDLSEHRTWDHGYAETVYSAQSKTYPRILVLAPVESPPVNAQNFYTAITRAALGARLWTRDVKALIAKLERQSGEKTSSSEGLGRLTADRADALSSRRGHHLANLKAGPVTALRRSLERLELATGDRPGSLRKDHCHDLPRLDPLASTAKLQFRAISAAAAVTAASAAHISALIAVPAWAIFMGRAAYYEPGNLGLISSDSPEVQGAAVSLTGW
ncbi:MAG: hypothetical protein ACSLE1_05225 [Sphingobium sp.]